MVVAASKGRLLGVLLGLLIGFVTTFVLNRRTEVKFRDYLAQTEVDYHSHQKLHNSPTRFSVSSLRQDQVLCWVPILEVTPIERAKIFNTWGRRCDKFYFVAKEGSLDDGIIAHGYERKDKFDLWNQVHRGWARIAEMHLHEFDWFVKLDSDSFFIKENLLQLAVQNNWTADSIVYFGRLIFEQSRPINEVRAQFNLGAGYGVSRKVLELVYPYLPTALNSTIPIDKRCPEWERWGEDVKFADCARFALPTLLPNVTRDIHGREHFMMFPPTYHILAQNPPWVYRGQEVLKTAQKGPRCCSSRPVLWHGMEGTAWFLVLEYFHTDVAVDPRPPPV